MKLKIILPIIALIGTFAGAADPQNQDALWERADRESQWPISNLKIPGLEGETRVVRTHTGAIKIDSLADVYVSEGQVKSREFRRYRDLNQYLEQCKRQAPIFGAIRNLGNRFDLKFKVIGGNHEAMDTKFLPPDHFEVKLEVAEDGISRFDRKFDLASYQQKIYAQVQEQLSEIPSTGEISLTFKGYDDVVCDLISGKAKVSVQVWYHYTLAKLRRETRVTAMEAARIYDETRQKFQVAKSAYNNLILGSIALGSALERVQVKFENLNDWEKLRLHGLLFDKENGELRRLDHPEIAIVASRMDRLSDGYTYSMPIFRVQVASPFGSEQ